MMRVLSPKLITSIAGIVAVFILVSLAQEMNRRLQVQREVAKLQQEVHGLEKTIVEMENLNQYFDTDDFQERMAREKLNYRAAGETVVLTLALWGWVLSSDETLNNPVASYVGWPVACSVRGCITTKTWQSHYRTRQAFAKAVEQEAPQPVKALTTLLRQHLVEHAFLRTPVTVREAARYREEILGARDEGQVLLASGLTIEEYDQFVI